MQCNDTKTELIDVSVLYLQKMQEKILGIKKRVLQQASPFPTVHDPGHFEC
jgi:hypothetical protein